MSRLRPKLPARLRGKSFSLEEGERSQKLEHHRSTAGDEILRMAAIAAVMSLLDSSGPDPAQIGRQAGPAWALDHRRQASGKHSLLLQRQARSTWR